MTTPYIVSNNNAQSSSIFTTANGSVPPGTDVHKECLNKFIEILQNEVVAYFDTVIPKLLNLWMAIIENIFKYYINLNRIIQTKLILEKK
jgi:hypothetical protein